MVEALVGYQDYTVIVLWVLMLLAAVAIAARPLRIDIQDGLYHVTRPGWERRVVVRDAKPAP